MHIDKNIQTYTNKDKLACFRIYSNLWFRDTISILAMH